LVPPPLTQEEEQLREQKEREKKLAKRQVTFWILNIIYVRVEYLSPVLFFGLPDPDPLVRDTDPDPNKNI
jgi:hypothetical protein